MVLSFQSNLLCGLPLLEAAEPIYQLYGKKDRLRWHINEDPGTHNFELDNRQALYRMLADHFFPGDTGCTVEEIECEAEVRTADDLHIELPADNADFNKLALQLSSDLPRDAKLPSTAKKAQAWRRRKVKLLNDIVRAQVYRVQAEQAGEENKEAVHATFWKLHLGDVWTLAAVELSTGKSQKTAIVVADEGYAAQTATIGKGICFDSACLCTTLLRIKQIPAWTVLGAVLRTKSKRFLGLHAWTETIMENGTQVVIETTVHPHPPELIKTSQIYNGRLPITYDPFAWFNESEWKEDKEKVALYEGMILGKQ